jgi:hypothetical protein
MRELGIDLAGRAPTVLSDEAAERADVVVTMGCGDECPYIPGKRYPDWNIPDPHGREPLEVRAIRDEIARRVDELVGSSTRVAQAHKPDACRPRHRPVSLAPARKTRRSAWGGRAHTGRGCWGAPPPFSSRAVGQAPAQLLISVPSVAPAKLGAFGGGTKGHFRGGT